MNSLSKKKTGSDSPSVHVTKGKKSRTFMTLSALLA